MASSLSRRSFLKNTSAGVAAYVALTTAGGEAQAKPSQAAAPAATPGMSLAALLPAGAPLHGGWHVDRVQEGHAGALVVQVSNPATHESLRIDVCRAGAQDSGVETKSGFAFIVMNGGTGSTHTDRRHHLLVRAIAKKLSSAKAAATGLMTHGERTAAFGAARVSASPFAQA